VLTGTCAEYAWGGDCLREGETPLHAATLYGVCKHATHIAAAAYARQTGLSLGWGRLFFLYGPYEADGRLVSSVTRSLLAGEVARCSRGNQLRDFLYVGDAAEAFVALLDSSAEGAFNVASGKPVAIRTVVEILGAITGLPEQIMLGAVQQREGDPARICADVSSLRAATGWSPQYSLEEGLRRTVEWWSTRGAVVEHA
jgi:nucleoside-diphosphate-sugar epimerase